MHATPRQLVGTALLLVGLLVPAVFLLARRGGQVEQPFLVTPPAQQASSQQPAPPSATTTSEVVVHVVGAVRRPGVYHLPPGARIEDAVRLAGGPAPDADVNAVNLAALARDGERIEVPLRAAANPQTASALVPVGGRPPGDGGGSGGKLRNPGQGTVNVNTAGEAELERLPGVGPATAARIIAHRKENGPFRSVDDLLAVSGIGPKKLAAMRPFVKL